MALKITSPAFADDGEIPRKYTCEGEDVSPPLAFSGVPDGAASLVLIVDDPDAPDPKAPKMTYVHWVLFDLPPDTTEIIEGMVALPIGTKSGLND
jgi:Raf kinase inhibitor-like YbhB/YbcL family protein